jgi:hypothetical protein
MLVAIKRYRKTKERKKMVKSEGNMVQKIINRERERES